MSKSAQKLKEALTQFVISILGDLVATGEVESIDETNYTCDVVKPNGMQLFNVQLAALRESGKGCVIMPKVKTTVHMLKRSQTDYLVISVEEADKVIQLVDTGIKTVTGKLEIEAKETIFNGGKNGGIPIAGNVAERLNNIEQLLADLLADYKKHTHPTAATGPASPPTVPFAKKAPTKTKAEDIENPKVKH